MVDRPSALPYPPAPLLGREREVRVATALLRDPAVRLVTLTGPGGMGKTRLALAVAHDLDAELTDGVVFVELAPVPAPEFVPHAIARAVGVREAGDAPLPARLARWARARRGLLLLDNLEHLLDAAPLVADLLDAGPGLRVLATSRERLRIAGEHEIPVPALALAASDDVGAAVVGAASAVRLLAERARAVSRGFALTDDNAASVAAICARLDGLPLPIELAAARAKLFPPEALLARLEPRLPLLAGGRRDAPGRQRTMRDAIAWSYDLLAPAEQALFRRLSIFAGGCTLDAAEAMAGADVLEGVASLVDKSLLRPEPGCDGEPRFTMLETIREFGLERRAAAEIHGPGMRRWCDALEASHPNLRLALDAFADAGDPAAELELAAALGAFWFHRGHLREGIARLCDAVHRGGAAPPALRADALAWVGHLALSLGDRAAMRAAGTDALALAHDSGDDVAVAHACYVRALDEG